MHIEPDGVGEIEELDHVDPTLAGLDGGDERLVPSKRLRDVALGQAGRFTGLGQELGQPLMARRAERAGHAGPRRDRRWIRGMVGYI